MKNPQGVFNDCRVRDEWNNLNVAHIIIAIFVVGIVGLLLEKSLLLLARRFNYE